MAKDAMIGARQQSVMHGVLAAEFRVPPRAALDRVDIADQIGDSPRRELRVFPRTAVSGVRYAMGVVSPSSAIFSWQGRQMGAYGFVMNLATCGRRGPWGSSNEVSARRIRLFGLAAQSQQNEIVTRKNCVGRSEARQCPSYPTMPGKIAPPWRSFAIRLSAHLVFHASGTQPLFAKWTLAQFAERPPGRLMMEKPPVENSFCSDYTPPHYGLSAGPKFINHEGTRTYTKVYGARTGRGEGLSFLRSLQLRFSDV